MENNNSNKNKITVTLMQPRKHYLAVNLKGIKLRSYLQALIKANLKLFINYRKNMSWMVGWYFIIASFLLHF